MECFVSGKENSSIYIQKVKKKTPKEEESENSTLTNMKAAVNTATKVGPP